MEGNPLPVDRAPELRSSQRGRRRPRHGHDIIERALLALTILAHRGATGADPLVGDRAGILTQVPDRFFREILDFDLPEPRHYAVGTAYVPRQAGERAERTARIEAIVRAEGLVVLGWRGAARGVDRHLMGASQLPRPIAPSDRTLIV